jgi:hypothetical protein
MNNQPHFDKDRRYLLEFRLLGETNWLPGSSFRNLNDAKECVDNTLKNVQDIVEGRVFDRKLLAYRYYRGAYPFKA